MTLYQIQEPVAAKPTFAVGIDLGTTHSLIAAHQEGGITVFGDRTPEGALLPSVVSYTEEAIYTGEAAQQQKEACPNTTFSSMKRLMGQGMESAEGLPYLPAKGNHKLPTFITPQGDITPIQVASEILKALLLRAEVAAAQSVSGMVITVPAYFDEAARKAAKDAAKLTGVPLMRLVNEPTAAAIAYGLDKSAQGTFLVYDFGGGTFDISLLVREGGIFEVRAVSGDTQLGGDDIDAAIVDWFLEQTAQSLSPEARAQALLLARQAKEALSHTPEVTLSIGKNAFLLSQKQLAAIIQPLVDKTLSLVEGLLKEANLEKSKVDDCILVGGSCRMPLVQAAVERWFTRATRCDINPDQVVAIGAAHQAAALSGQANTDLLLLDVNPLSVGLEMMGGLHEKMILRNTPLPASMKRRFTTAKDGQTGLELTILQGEREKAEACRQLAQCRLSGIPAKPAGTAVIEVTFTLDVDGLLTVSAEEQTSKQSVAIEVNPTYGLSEAQLQETLSSAIDHAQEDIAYAQRQAQIAESRQLLEAVQKAVAEDPASWLEKAVRENLEAASTALGSAIENESSRAAEIKACHESLEAAAGPYFEKRLQLSLDAAVSGKNVEELLCQP